MCSDLKCCHSGKYKTIYSKQHLSGWYQWSVYSHVNTQSSTHKCHEVLWFGLGLKIRAALGLLMFLCCLFSNQACFISRIGPLTKPVNNGSNWSHIILSTVRVLATAAIN